MATGAIGVSTCMENWLDLESKEFRKALETEIECRRGTRAPEGFLVLESLNRELQFTTRARAIASHYDVNTEQACFAIVRAMKQMGWI
jgi:hypothetical protein